MENGMTPVDELTGMIEQCNAVDIRLALYREKEAWRIGYGEVLIGADSSPHERTWTYGEDAFIERRLPGPSAADLVRGMSQQVAELSVSAPAPQDSSSFQRIAGQVRYNNAVLPWPRTNGSSARRRKPRPGRGG
ncbi:hypothetical protein ABTW72_03150 [Micromonospora sp. NPDC127501]|uniref:hypothetical protein n=1 Tax=Micromonospora sp. NPDC127501 TaxID=3154872 RepID=UPI00332E5BD1